MNWSGLSAVLLALAVGLGAFGAHGLKARLDAYSMGIYEKAVFYHFIHALGMLIVSSLPKAGALTHSAAAWVCALLLAGILIFSGSLYALATSGVRLLGAITPVGGVSFIAAWLLLAWALFRGGAR
ncbi:MAG: DUF423 domain-containing protein [Acidobacteriota bacterium]